jgi:putative transposase
VKTSCQLWERPVKGDVRAEIALHTHKTLVQKLRYIKEVNQWGCLMPRSARLDASGILHHVMGRGIEKGAIFLDAKDREDFIARLAALAETKAITVYSWALLPNHFHLLCKTEKSPLSCSMRTLLTGYAVRFNRRHKRHGHLFQNRYKSIVCQEDRYLLELVRYIHLNPLRAGEVASMEQLNLFPWSGHSTLMGQIRREWQDTKYILSLFGNGLMERRNYLSFVGEEIARGRRPDLVGGGLIRSRGGWAEVLSARRHKETQAFDQRILGDDEFVKRVLTEANDFIKTNLRFGGKRMALPSLGERVCEVHEVSLGELRSGSRRREIVEARRTFSWLAVKELGYSGAEIARYLGVTTSCVTRGITQVDGFEREKYLDI